MRVAPRDNQMASSTADVLYYGTVFLTALVFLTEASAITTNYEKSVSREENRTHDAPHRTKLTATRGRHVKNDRGIHQLFIEYRSNVTAKDTVQELMALANTGGEEVAVAPVGNDSNTDEDDKTLSQQVADGKYGLIQNEIYSTEPSRPGIISYDINPEVPKDNINTFGGLEPDDIWLAENHLLVLAGGGLYQGQTQWQPIDNYVAPRRQVKLPINPKVPPPFPVQLSDGGPIDFLNTENGQISSFPFVNNMSFHPLYGIVNSAISPLYPKNKHSPLPPPIAVKPPPGAEFIPPYLGNSSEPIDEDDPSLYYPPPYDFYYPKDNTSKVPAGPLVPGIVLPPPPDFFTLQSNKTSKSKDMYKTPSIKSKPIWKPHKTGKQLIENKSKMENSNEEMAIRYEDIINDVRYPDIKGDKITYPDVIGKKNTHSEEDWIPIPAPQPYYITGTKKPVKNTVLLMVDAPPQGYDYKKPQFTYQYSLEEQIPQITTTQRTKYRKPETKYLKHFDQVFPSTTPIIPQIVSTKSKTNQLSTTPLSSADYQSKPIKATYYFYEEPQFGKSHLTDFSAPFTHTTPTPVTINPHVTSSDDYQQQVTHKPYFSTAQPSKLSYYNTNHHSTSENYKQREPIKPMIPIYYLAEVSDLMDSKKPSTLSPQNNYYQTPSTPSYADSKLHYNQGTSHPIFEYSYVASDYAGPQSQISQPISQLYQPTSVESDYDDVPQSQISQPSPQHYQQPSLTAPQSHLSQHYQTQSPFQQIVNNLNQYEQYNRPTQTTARPILNVFLNEKPYYSPVKHQSDYNNPAFERPWPDPYNRVAYTTENPFYAFFTKEDSDLIDENTKKYFSIFGQKIKSEPATPTYAESQQQQDYSTRAPSLKDDYKVNNVKTLPREPLAEYISQRTRLKPIIVEDIPAEQSKDRRRNKQRSGAYRYMLVDHPTTEFESLGSNLQYRYESDEDAASSGESGKPVSLDSDILVNYKNADKLTKNPNAELIDVRNKNSPRNSGSNVVSYTYPGVERGHFYFSTPQESHLSQIEDEQSDFQNDAESPGKYFKRVPRKFQNGTSSEDNVE